MGRESSLTYLGKISASNSTVSTPSRASVQAVYEPAGPPPITKTEVFCGIDMFSCLDVVESMLSEGRDNTVPFSLPALIYQRIRNASRVYVSLLQRLGALEAAVPWEPWCQGTRGSMSSNRAMLSMFGSEVCSTDSTSINFSQALKRFRSSKPGRIIPNFRPPRSSIL